MDSELRKKIVDKSAIVSIIGLGYVGLPLAIEAAKAGYSVIGIDIDEARVGAVRSGLNFTAEKGDVELTGLVESGKIRASANFADSSEADIFVVCVPTALNNNLFPDLQHIKEVSSQIGEVLTKGRLISVESTIFPGATEELILPILANAGLEPEKDFYLCHSPERIDPGNKNYSTKNICKLVGGIGEKSLALGELFYSSFLNQVLPVQNVKVAELAKLHENTFRAVNIALVNELALLCDEMGISIWEVLDAAYSKPFGIMSFFPGPGVGGHCIPVDPHYLEWKAREYNFFTKLIAVAGEINRKMPKFVREKMIRVLNNLGVALSCSKVLVIGLAYKKDTADFRESPVLDLIEMLFKDGVEVRYYDPYVQQAEVAGCQLRSVSLDSTCVQWADLIVIATDHSEIDYCWLVKTANKIIDTRNATKFVQGRQNKVITL